MNVYRFIGAIGLAAGITALALIFAPDMDAGRWIPDVLTAEFHDQAIRHFLGGIGAVASGGYLILFANT